MVAVMTDGIDGKALRRLRRDADLTIDELGKRAEVDPSSISRIERGYRRPTARVLQAILAVLLSEQTHAAIRDRGEEIERLLRARTVGPLVRS